MSNSRNLIIMGAGGHAAVVIDAAIASGWNVIGFLDDEADMSDTPRTYDLLPRAPRLGNIDDVPSVIGTQSEPVAVHAAIGDPQLRRRWLDLAAPHVAPPIIHPSAVVSPSAQLAEGAFIAPRAVVNARASLGRGVIINTTAVVEHDCTIADFAHLAPAATLGGSVIVGENTLVGINASVKPGITIGRNVTVAAAAAVVSDIPHETTVAGVPARPLPAPSTT